MALHGAGQRLPSVLATARHPAHLPDGPMQRSLASCSDPVSGTAWGRSATAFSLGYGARARSELRPRSLSRASQLGLGCPFFPAPSPPPLPPSPIRLHHFSTDSVNPSLFQKLGADQHGSVQQQYHGYAHGKRRQQPASMMSGGELPPSGSVCMTAWVWVWHFWTMNWLCAWCMHGAW